MITAVKLDFAVHATTSHFKTTITMLLLTTIILLINFRPTAGETGGHSSTAFVSVMTADCLNKDWLPFG